MIKGQSKWSAIDDCETQYASVVCKYVFPDDRVRIRPGNRVYRIDKKSTTRLDY